MWWWIQILIVLFGIFIVWTFFIRQEVIKNRLFACLSIALTLFGIAIAIADEYLSQYDYDPHTILKHETYRKKGVPFEGLLNGGINMPPEYIFVMDVSGSMVSKNYGNKNERYTIE